MADASNFQNSTFWDPDTTSGVGGWGDPNDDYQTTDGGPADDPTVSYPSPHRLRRNYTPTDSDNPDVLFTSTFTPESQVAMVNDFEGNFVGFHARFEPGSHRSIRYIVGGCIDPLNALWFLLLTDGIEPTQRSFWGLPIDRPCGLCTRPQVVPQWCAPDQCVQPDISNPDISVDPLLMLHHAVRRTSENSLIF
jgi:hypothetical protein